MSKQTPEGELKKKVKDYLKSIGVYSFMPVQTMYGTRALDLIVCYKGLFISIETKVKPNKPTKQQLKVMNAIREAGGLAFVAYSLEDVKRQMEPL